MRGSDENQKILRRSHPAGESPGRGATGSGADAFGRD